MWREGTPSNCAPPRRSISTVPPLPPGGHTPIGARSGGPHVPQRSRDSKEPAPEGHNNWLEDTQNPPPPTNGPAGPAGPESREQSKQGGPSPTPSSPQRGGPRCPPQDWAPEKTGLSRELKPLRDAPVGGRGADAPPPPCWQSDGASPCASTQPAYNSGPSGSSVPQAT